MGEQAFNSVVSQPISAIRGISYSTDTKRQEALQRSAGLTQGIYESVDAYHDRMKKFYEEHAKKVEAENTAIAEKRYNEILSQYLNSTNDVSKLEKGLSDLQSLFRFANFNKLNSSFDNNIYLAKKQENLMSNKLYKIKNGQEDTSSNSSNPMLYSGDYQEPGKRDFLC